MKTHPASCASGNLASIAGAGLTPSQENSRPSSRLPGLQLASNAEAPRPWTMGEWKAFGLNNPNGLNPIQSFAPKMAQQIAPVLDRALPLANLIVNVTADRVDSRTSSELSMSADEYRAFIHSMGISQELTHLFDRAVPTPGFSTELTLDVIKHAGTENQAALKEARAQGTLETRMNPMLDTVEHEALCGLIEILQEGERMIMKTCSGARVPPLNADPIGSGTTPNPPD